MPDLKETLPWILNLASVFSIASIRHDLYKNGQSVYTHDIVVPYLLNSLSRSYMSVCVAAEHMLRRLRALMCYTSLSQ